MVATGRRRLLPFKFWTWAHRAVAAGFFLVLLVSAYRNTAWLPGTPTATRLLGWGPFVDPLAVLEVSVASRTVSTSLVLGAAIPILLAIGLGRVFCGWLCPLGLLLEINEMLRRTVLRRVSRDRTTGAAWAIPSSTKLWVLLIVLGISTIGAIPLFTALSPINLVVLGAFSVTENAAQSLGMRVPSHMGAFAQPALAAIAGAILGTIVVVEWAVPRVFCRAICPAGALFGLLGRFSLLRVRVAPGGRRISCRHCTTNCPMGIDVMTDHVLVGHQAVDDPDCTRCGVCTDVCRGGLLKLGFRNSPDEPEPLQSALQKPPA